MLWKLRRPSITIPVELHEKIAQSCSCINHISSEVISVRPLPEHRRNLKKRGHGLNTIGPRSTLRIGKPCD